MALSEVPQSGSWERQEQFVLSEIKSLNEKAEKLENAVSESKETLLIIRDRLGEKGLLALQIEQLKVTMQGSIDVMRQDFSSKVGALTNQIEEIKRRDIKGVSVRYDDLEKRLILQNNRISTVERRTDFIKAWAAGGSFVLFGFWWLWKNVIEPYLKGT